MKLPFNEKIIHTMYVIIILVLLTIIVWLYFQVKIEQIRMIE